jgi:hypothetical protein
MVDRYPQRGQRLDEFAALDPFEYERQRKIAAKQLSDRPWVVDAIRLQLHALAGAQSRSGDGAAPGLSFEP